MSKRTKESKMDVEMKDPRWTNFVHRPVKVKGFRFDEKDCPGWIKRDPRAVGFMKYRFENKYGEDVFLDHGDWIVQYPDGERFVLPDGFFSRRFEKLL